MDISHKNIVRIYNYYLYPSKKAGYIQMEYIDGTSIDKFVPSSKKDWDSLFVDAIDSFSYLEEKGIIHRDIRPGNFMITYQNELKILDFGFGKKFNSDNYDHNSVLLNWPATEVPEEIVTNKQYDFKTEIYYLGNMFKNLIREQSCSYEPIVKKMCEIKTSQRYQSFNEIKKEISESLFTKIKFTPEEKKLYSDFVNPMSQSLVNFSNDVVYEKNLDKVIESLQESIKLNALENMIQGNNNIISCFIKSSYRYKNENMIPVESVLNFYRLLISLSDELKTIVLQNVINHLLVKPIKKDYDIELPF